MTKPNLSAIAKELKGAMIQHSPEILTGIGIAGMITTTVMAVKSTPKALDLMAELKEKHKNDTEKKEIAKDVVTKVAPVYLPSVITGGLSIACLIGASSVNARRNAALATAYTLSESALKEYQEKVVATIGEKKEKNVRDAIAKDKVDKNPVSNCEVIITEKGNTLCYDTISGRYFTSDIEKLKRTENELNKRLLSEMYIGLNELYYELGLRCTDQGNELGWNINDGMINFDFSSQLADDGRPCLVVGYRVGPRYGYGDLH
ncbi:MAG: DUF6353 family protein [Lachnospiraceae bacterium]|nr:DUF6353 family protein [Lachnospiraceae bacterium]